MGSKKLIFGITAIVVVTAIFIVSERLTSIRPPEHRAKFFPGLAERHVSAVLMSERGAVTSLVKTDGVWMVGKEDDFHPANESLVQIAIERIISLKKNELISDNPDKQSDLGVDSASAASVEIFTDDHNNPAHVILIGKNGPDWNSNYARLAGSNAVYLVPGNLRQALFFDIERWKKPVPAEPEPAIDAGSDTASAFLPEQKESADSGAAP